MLRFRKSIGERGNNKGPARPTSGGYAARRCPMLGELSLVYVGMPRNSARLVALLLNRQIMREDGAKTMSKGVTGEIRGPGDTTETTSRDVTSMTTNDGHVRR